MAQMIDLHCHILPGLDDGAADVNEAAAMARIAAADGIETIVATPHFDGVDRSFPSRAVVARDQLQVALQEHELPVTVLLGFELLLTPSLLEWGTDLRSLGLNAGQYLLVELPQGFWPPYLHDVLFRLQGLGARPILAHAERYDAITRNPDLAAELTERGVYLQVNSHSLLGLHGSAAQRSARALIERGVVHLVASDAHASTGRTPSLRAAHEHLSRTLGPASAMALVRDNPASVVADADLSIPPPARRPRRFFALSGKGR